MNTTLNMKKRLPNKEFRRLVPKLREKGFYKSQEKRPIEWKKYNKAQTEEASILLKEINKFVDCCKVKKLSKLGRKGVNPKILVKVILLCELFQLTERQAQSLIYLMGFHINLNSKIDDRTIGRAYNSLEVQYLLRQVFEKTKHSDEVLSGDGTGLETTRKQNYESTKNKKQGQYMTSIIDSREIVQAFDISGTQECKIMHKLIEEVKGNSLRLDAGFVDRKLTAKISELGMKPFIFPKKNINLNGRIAWKLMYLDLFFETQEWLREYHQRSHTESFHSSFKRKNKPVLKNNPISRLNQITARIIIHNLRKLSYYDLF
jgi:transposase